ncbi:MAG: RNA 2',3'-cyclic phosphodiesterase [Burkholderiales bacterium]
MSASAITPRRPGARLFFALWPEVRVRDALASLAHDVQVECGGRATPAEKIHLTLFFVGQVERDRIAELERIGAAVRAAPFELVFDQVGYFRHNRIAWAGAACPPSLGALAAKLRENLSSERDNAEDRPYVPHVTLVRDALRKPASRSVPAVSWRTHDFVLVESVMSDRSRYEIIAGWNLRD